MARILALGAHPDDVEIYMSGMLFAAAAQGADLRVAVATDGARGGPGGEALARTRRAEAEEGAALLGAPLHMLGFPDGGLAADAPLIAALKALFEETEPDLVVTHAPNDYHADHRALAGAARIAVSFGHPLLWADTMNGAGFAPTHYVDVTARMEAKCAAIRAHASQEPERFVERMRMHNGFRASQCNAAPGSYAEAYRFEPVFPFADIRALLPPPPPLAPVRLRRD